MNFEEFSAQISRLSGEFPQHFNSKGRVQLIFERVKDFEVAWLRKIVDRIILTNDPRFNFDDAARGERLSRKNTQLTQDVIAASDALSGQISEKGLSEALKAFGANSLLDVLNQKPDSL